MSGFQNYETPPWLFAELQRLVGKPFKLDAAASAENALCRRYYTVADDSLSKPWSDVTFCNPPFTRFGDWIMKSYQESVRLNGIICLIGPAGCSQTWFHRYAIYGTVLVPDQRIIFYRDHKLTRGARADNAVYLFGPKWWNRRSHLQEFRISQLLTGGQR